MNRNCTFRLAGLLCGVLASTTAAAGELTFEGLTHGTVISTQDSSAPASQFTLPPDLAYIEVDNNVRSHDIGVAFDTRLTGTADPDLEGPPNGTWATGNIAPTTNLGLIAIIQENDSGCSTGVCSSPDDEGVRLSNPPPSTGSIVLGFNKAIDSIGFDLIDVEGPDEYGNNAGYVAMFYMGGSAIGSVGFGDFVTPGNQFYDATTAAFGAVTYGNNSANRIAPITAAMFGETAFDRVEFNFGGSAGIDNINWTTPPSGAPEPGTVALLALGLAGLASRRRR